MHVSGGSAKLRDKSRTFDGSGNFEVPRITVPRPTSKLPGYGSSFFMWSVIKTVKLHIRESSSNKKTAQMCFAESFFIC